MSDYSEERCKENPTRATSKWKGDELGSGANSLITHLTISVILHCSTKIPKVKKRKSFIFRMASIISYFLRHSGTKCWHLLKEYKHLSAQDWVKYIFSDESTSILNCFMFRITMVAQSGNVPNANCVKSSSKVMIWGVMDVNRLFLLEKLYNKLLHWAYSAERAKISF